MLRQLALLGNHSFYVVALGATILGMMTGALGTFTLLRKESLLGDGIAHCALSGVVLAFLVTGEKSISILLVGGTISGILGYCTILAITKYSKIKFDSGLAMTLSVFFAFGLVLLSLAQKNTSTSGAGLQSFLYGQAAAMLRGDVITIALCSLVVALVLFVFWKPCKLLTFDPVQAKIIGYPWKLLHLVLHFLMVLAIVLGLQTVGVILMSAMLIAPSIAARPWVTSLSQMVLLSSVFGGISGLLGTTVSALYSGMPTGAVIVVIASFFGFFGLLFGKETGISRKNFEKKRKNK